MKNPKIPSIFTPSTNIFLVRAFSIISNYLQQRKFLKTFENQGDRYDYRTFRLKLSSSAHRDKTFLKKFSNFENFYNNENMEMFFENW